MTRLDTRTGDHAGPRTTVRTASSAPHVGDGADGRPSRHLAPTHRRRSRRRNLRRPPSGLISVSPGPVSVADRATATAAAESEYRMSRRVIVLLVVAVVVAVALTATQRLSTGPAATTTVTVSSGDSLWTIAQRAVPDGDTGAVMAEISELNALTSDIVRPGEVLLVPVG
jgi:LysM repeat protein